MLYLIGDGHLLHKKVMGSVTLHFHNLHHKGIHHPNPQMHGQATHLFLGREGTDKTQ